MKEKSKNLVNRISTYLDFIWLRWACRGGGSDPANLVQENYAKGADDSADPDTCTFGAVNGTGLEHAKSDPFMLRISVSNTGGKDGGVVAKSLVYTTASEADPATNGTPITTTSNVIRIVNDGGGIADQALTDAEVTGGTGTRIDGYYTDASDATTATKVTDGNWAEYQFCIQFQSDATESQDYYIYVLEDGANLDSYSQVPTITALSAGSQDATATPSLISISLTVGTPTLVVSGGDYALDTNCMGLWLMTSDGNETDLSGENGTLEGSGVAIATSADSPYTSGFSRMFVYGDSSQLEHNDGLSTDISGADQPISFCAWLKGSSWVANGQTDYVAVTKYDFGSSDRAYALWVEDVGTNDRRLRGRISSNGADPSANITGTATIVEDVWHHGAVVSNDTDVRLYLDGELAATAYVYGSGIHNSSAKFVVGNWYNDNNYFSGNITEVGVFDRALTAEEISNIYNNGLRGNLTLDSGSVSATATPSLVSMTVVVNSPTTEVHGGDYALDTNCMGLWLMTSDGNETDLSGEGGTLIPSTPNAIGTSVDSPYTSGFSRVFEYDDHEFLYHSDGNSTDISGANQDMSMCAWFKLDGYPNGSDPTIMSKYHADADARQYLMNVNAGAGNLQGLVRNFANDNNYNHAAGVISTNTWHHGVITYDSSNDPDKIWVYVDGVLVGTDNEVATTDGINDGTEIFRIGARNENAPAHNLDGYITEVAVFNDVLTAEEISNIYNNGLRGNLTLDTGEVITTATPSLVSVSLTTNTPTTSFQKSATVTTTLVSSSVTIGTPVLAYSKSATVATTLVSSSITLEAPALLYQQSALVTTTLLSSSVTLETPVLAISKSATTATNLVQTSLTLGTPVLVYSKSATVATALLSSSITLETPATQAHANAIVTATLVPVSITIETPVAGSLVLTKAEPSLVSISATVGAPVLVISKSSVATATLVQTSITLGVPVAGSIAGATAQPTLLSLSLTTEAPTAVAYANRLVEVVLKETTIFLETAVASGQSGEVITTASPAVIESSILISQPTPKVSKSATVAVALQTVSVTTETPTTATSTSATVSVGTILMTVVTGTPTPTVTENRIAQPSLQTARFTLTAPTIVITEEGVTSGITIHILLESAMSKRISLKNRMQTIILKESGTEKSVYAESRMKKDILEESGMSKLIVGESKL